jgi:uncharacterized membrane protein YidH (DUF202 family)
MNETKLGLNDILALDRTRLAAERTLMGWIRTSFSMITFGFTIYKVMQEVGQVGATSPAPVSESRHLGLVLAGLVQVSGRRRRRTLRTLGRPASRKRQGTKSRSAGPAAGSGALWGFQVGGASGGGETPGRRDRGACTRRRA